MGKLITPDAPADVATADPAPGETLTVLEYAVYRGPHIYSRLPMVRIQIDLGELERFPSNTLAGFTDRLMAALPRLAAHGCSYHEAGGFERRLREGTWLGHIAEHVALELQTLAGQPLTRGKTRSIRGRTGVYDVLFAYEDDQVGLRAGAHALRLVDSLLPEALRGLRGLPLLKAGDLDRLPFSLEAALDDLRTRVRARALGPTTHSLVDDHLVDQLGRAGRTLGSTPQSGEVVVLRATANLSTGGSAIDRTEGVHPDNIEVAEQAAALIGLDVAGVDFILSDAARSVRQTGGGIVEINAAPGFRMHLDPAAGLPRSVARLSLRNASGAAVYDQRPDAARC